MPRSAASSSVPGLDTATHIGGCGFWYGLGSTARVGHGEELALEAEALLRPHLGDGVDELVPALLGLVGVGPEAAELGPGGRAAGAELEPAAGEDVEHGGPLGDADRVVELGDADHDAVPDADVLGLHGAGGEEQLGRGAVRVLLEEVVLDRPHLVEAQLVGQAHLLERVHVDRALALAVPGTGHGQLVEDAELHRLEPPDVKMGVRLYRWLLCRAAVDPRRRVLSTESPRSSLACRCGRPLWGARSVATRRPSSVGGEGVTSTVDRGTEPFVGGPGAARWMDARFGSLGCGRRGRRRSGDQGVVGEDVGVLGRRGRGEQLGR